MRASNTIAEHAGDVMGMRGEVAIMRLIPKLARLSDASTLDGVTFTLHNRKVQESQSSVIATKGILHPLKFRLSA